MKKRKKAYGRRPHKARSAHKVDWVEVAILILVGGLIVVMAWLLIEGMI